ncbi:MAG TPA: NADH dehydrogenase ubiquinone Fe-S protein 4 [Microvirga sp.]|nr:NADH dehydrogenase ubiquinone Fe-S protein 4 [Microvirga sp.]
MEVMSVGIGHNRPPMHVPITRPSWPESAAARIYRPARSVTSSAPGRSRTWVLCFERRKPPFIEPLMGWTGSEDPLTQVELRFDTLDEAVRHAEREGLAYRIDGEVVPTTRTERRQVQDRQAAAERLYAAAAALAWMDPRYGVAAVGRRPDLDRALINPAAVFSSPQEVLNDASLTFGDKREIPRRWAWDAWLLETAADEAMADGESSRLDEVKAALHTLEEAERTSMLVMARKAGGGMPLTR